MLAIINSSVRTMPMNLRYLNGKGVQVTFNSRTMQKTLLRCQFIRWLWEKKKKILKKSYNS